MILSPDDPPRPAPPAWADLLRLRREAKGMKVRAVASLAGVSPSYVSQLELGYRRAVRGGPWELVRPERRYLAAVAAALDIEPDRLEQAGQPGAADVLREKLRDQKERESQRPDEIPASVRDIAGEFRVSAEELWADPHDRKVWQTEATSLRTRIAYMRLAASRLADRREASAGEAGWQQRALSATRPAAVPRPRLPGLAASSRVPDPAPGAGVPGRLLLPPGCLTAPAQHLFPY